MRATVSSVTCGAKARAYCERSVRPAIISVNQRIAHAVRTSPVGDAAAGAVSAWAFATGPSASKAISSASTMRLNRTTARWLGFAVRVNMLEPSQVEGGRPKPPSQSPAISRRRLERAAAYGFRSADAAAEPGRPDAVDREPGHWSPRRQSAECLETP